MAKAPTADQESENTSEDQDFADDPEARLERAETIVKDHVLMGAAVGLIPSPGIDIAASFGLQIAMVNRLCKLYDVPFSRSLVRGIVTSLFASLGSLLLAGPLTLSLVKLMPIGGTAAGMIGMPISIGAFTYALGKVFIGHFEAGGNLLNFDPRENRDYFRQMFHRGKKVAGDLRSKVSGKGEDTESAAAAA